MYIHGIGLEDWPEHIIIFDLIWFDCFDLIDWLDLIDYNSAHNTNRSSHAQQTEDIEPMGV